jgi:DNA-binding IscR family transcriptional regulator
MVRVRDAISDILDRLTLADMLALDGGDRAALMYHI